MCFAPKLSRQLEELSWLQNYFKGRRQNLILNRLIKLATVRKIIKMPLTCKMIANWTQNACIFGAKQISTQAYPLQIKISSALWAEPLKKKKKLDPAFIKAKEEKKKKRIMKEIKKLEKLERHLKPIAEFAIPSCLTDEPERRKRSVNLSEEVAEERILLLKKWSKFKLQEGHSDLVLLNRLMSAQQKALNELRLESEELYQAAVQIDPNLIPFKYIGPSETPPKEDYLVPDGAYIDQSKKYT